MIRQTKGAWLKHKAGQFKHYAIGGAALLGGIGLAHIANKSRHAARQPAWTQPGVRVEAPFRQHGFLYPVFGS